MAARQAEKTRGEKSQRKEFETTYRLSQTMRLFHWGFDDDGKMRGKTIDESEVSVQLPCTG